MKENLINLKYKDKEIVLIPTAHVSTESVKLVKETIEEFNPDSICVELDKDRYKILQIQKLGKIPI